MRKWTRCDLLSAHDIPSNQATTKPFQLNMMICFRCECVCVLKESIFIQIFEWQNICKQYNLYIKLKTIWPPDQTRVTRMNANSNRHLIIKSRIRWRLIGQRKFWWKFKLEWIWCCSNAKSKFRGSDLFPLYTFRVLNVMTVLCWV